MSLYSKYKRAGLIPEDMSNEVFVEMIDFLHERPDCAESICVEYYVKPSLAKPLLLGEGPHFDDSPDKIAS